MTELTGNDKKVERSLLVILIVIFSYLFVIFSALHSADKPIGGGDTWVAMACGRYSLGDWATHDNDRTVQMKILDWFGIHITWEDPFSANSRPYVKGVKNCEGWVNQNWLSHVMFYSLKTIFGEGTIVYYKYLQAVLTALFAFWAARALKVNYFIAAACAAFGVLLARSYIDMRPNISTILMASAMIHILFSWRAGNVKAILWMLPIMILWSNIHGGFIYAIVVFVIACGGYAISNILSASNPDVFEFHPWKEKYKWLLIGLAITIFTPMIFSPYGAENLLHPMMVMFGNEGKLWRDVSEWHPVYTDGFGNTGSFFAFLGIFGALALVWIVLRVKFRLPTITPTDGSVTTNGLIFFTAVPLAWMSSKVIKSNKSDSENNYKCMPTLDLAWLGIILLTIYMAITSRRFVFLAGVVLAPFMAVILEQIFIMTKDFWQKRISPLLVNMALVVVSALSVIFVASVFVAAVNSLYFSPAMDGKELSVFRRMVGINAQPVRAGEFLNLNEVKGVVLNEWANGGYVAWCQTPDKTTGRPPCKVYMDGRAQAAYRLEHFQRWQRININPAGGRRDYSEKERAYRQEQYNLLLQRAGMNSKTYQLNKKLVELYSQKPSNYDLLMMAMGVSPELYGEVLKNEGVTAVLAENAKSTKTIEYLGKLPDWDVLYTDESFTVILRKDALANRSLFDVAPEELKYPDDYSRNMSLADYYITYKVKGKEYRDCLLKADKYLAEIEDSDRVSAYGNIYRVKYLLNQKNELVKFFTSEYERLDKLVKEDVQFGKRTNLIAIHMCSHYLAALYKQAGDAEKEKYYTVAKNKYEKMIKSQREQLNSRLLW